jgi:RNA polymerase sigma-70 factor (ECF subfamily)
MSKDAKVLNLNAEQTKQFNNVYKEYKPLVDNYLRSKIKNADLRDDICANIFLKYARNMEKYDGRVKFNTWFFTLANNIITDHFRKESLSVVTNISQFVTEDKGDRGMEELVFTSDNCSSSAIENQELKRTIRRAIRSLKPVEKRIAILRLVKKYEYQEISEILEISLNSVKVMIMRTKESLQTALRTEYANL